MDGEPDFFPESDINSNLASMCSMTDQFYQTNKIDSLEKKAVHLRLILEKDFKAADMKWSLFVAGAFSFRYETCLRPYPPAYMKNGVKDMDELLNVIADVPALDLVLQQLDNHHNLESFGDILDLLFYVLVRLNEPTLKSVPVEAHTTLLNTTHLQFQAFKPQYVFKIISSNKSNAEMKWKEMAKKHNVFYAFHGNRLESFYSILHFGLHDHPNKSTLGGGSVIVLSPEMKACVPYSHGGFGWGASSIGGHLSAIAICEVVDAPEGIEFYRPVTSEGDGIYRDCRNIDKTSMNEQDQLRQLPHYIVTNCDLIRIRYLLVFAKQPMAVRLPSTFSNNRSGGSSIGQWIQKHKLFSILFGYGLMLATIGLANNHPINYYYNLLLKKLEFGYNNL